MGSIIAPSALLLRGYLMYYAQLNAVTSSRFVADTLLKHPHIAGLFLRPLPLSLNPQRNKALFEKS